MQDKKIVNIIRKMVILKLVKEIERDVFRPVTSVRQRKKSEFLWGIFTIYLQKMTLSTLSDPRSMQDACHSWTSQWNLLTVESLWLSGRASERGIRRSEVCSLMGTQIFFVPRSSKHLSLRNCRSHKSLILFYAEESHSFRRLFVGWHTGFSHRIYPNLDSVRKCILRNLSVCFHILR